MNSGKVVMMIVAGMFVVASEAQGMPKGIAVTDRVLTFSSEGHIATEEFTHYIDKGPIRSLMMGSGFVSFHTISSTTRSG